jgi:hypothetical protein
VSIGICVRYHDSTCEEEYWPYLAQLHLNDCLWPLASILGLERVELLEVLGDYQCADNVRALLVELESVCRYFDDATTAKEQYPNWEHVHNRTTELIQRLQQVLADWTAVEEVSFF